MATVSPPPVRHSVPPPAVLHPLERLSGTIRRYVLLEGLAVVVIYLALWFWLGLLVDFVVFKTFHVDWVQELPRGVRSTILAVLAAGLMLVLVVKLVRRLVVEFRPSALALVLERRFPAVLGDRLITAVELADLDRAADQGYSRAMVEQTVRDAAERVATVPVGEVFDWRRLRRMWVRVAALTLGVFLIAATAYSVARQTNPLHDFVVRFRDVAAIWIERNVLLQNTIWPRKAYLQVLDFPPSGDLRVGRDSPSPRLRVRAVRWLVADPDADEGWRAATWLDLERHADLARGPVPRIPETLLDSTDAGQRLTLDRVQMLLDQTDFRSTVSQEDLDGLKDLFENRLEATAAEPGMGRRFRQLDVPERVEVVYWGAKTSNEMPLNLGAGQEYAGPLTDLRESVKFRIRARDYSTATRRITLVPPPMIVKLTRDEDRPAYLFHRPPLDGKATALKGLKQHVADLGVSLSGPVSQFSAPAGTDVVLTGQVDKELEKASYFSRTPLKDAPVEVIPLELSTDRHAFQLKFPALSTEHDFDIELTDTDDVTSRRHVRIEPVKDAPPRVNVLIEGVRKTGQGYMVTPVALIPLVGTVADNSGIERVEYSLTVQLLETAATAAAQAASAAAAITQFAGGAAGHLIVGAATTGEINRLLSVGPEPRPMTFPLRSFEEMLSEKKLKDVTLEELRKRLAEAPPERLLLVPQFEVKPQFEGFDLRDRLADLKVKDESQIQPRYRLRLTVTATDNNIETGPGVGPNKEPPFNVFVVGELELLVEIAKEEQNLHFKMEDTVTRLRDAKLRLEKLAEELPSLPDSQMPTMAIRAQEVQETTAKARDVVQEVLTDYSRLLREMELNRVMPKLVERVKGDIVFPLESALRQEFVQAEEAQDGYRKTLEAGRKPDATATKRTQETLERLIERLSHVMDAMGEVTTINKLITKLREIEKGQEDDIARILKKMQDEQRKKIEAELDKLDKLDK
jgi:hypothetical protein